MDHRVRRRTFALPVPPTARELLMLAWEEDLLERTRAVSRAAVVNVHRLLGDKLPAGELPSTRQDRAHV